MSERPGTYMQTASGKKFYYLDPRPGDIVLDDIALALSNICRFTGQLREHYSVAEHSVRASEYVEAKLRETKSVALAQVRAAALAALMHDAQEAYVGDVASPLKKLIQGYDEVERGIASAIRDKFKLSTEWGELVHEADMVMLATEKRDLLPPITWPGFVLPDPLDERIVPWPADVARERFVVRYWGLLKDGIG